MAQEIHPRKGETENGSGFPVTPVVADHSSASVLREPKKRFRLPVGIAIGLVFSILFVAICGVIIGYLSISDRRIARNLLGEQARAVLKGNETVLHGFFKRQEHLLQSVAGHVARSGQKLTHADLASIYELLPRGVKLELGRTVFDPVPDDELPQVAWSHFQYKDGFRTAVRKVEIDLGNGQLLEAFFPQTVFARLVQEMAWDDKQRNFLLSGQNKVIAVNGAENGSFTASQDDPLPELSSFTSSPLHNLWQDTDKSETLRRSFDGRLFPADGHMYTAIYVEIGSGPAKGWIVGTLYRAEDFGAILDQTRAVLYVALAALIFGAVLSFMVGRLLGRPLTRLALAAAELRQLHFDAAERLPHSRLAEIDDVNQAFNGSIGALNAFAKYVPRELVSRLIEEGMTSSRNIELREMTIVFADLAGFTDMASHLSAEETATYLNAYFETVSDVIAECQGTIDKFLGDGVMAFWGAPSDQPNHAELAIRAVRSLAERIESSDKNNMRVRIGVHTGQVVVGDIGTTNRMNYTVIGDAVNVAARLQEHGKQVDAEARVIALASAETMTKLPQGIGAVSLGSVQLRGREEPLSVFRIA